MKIIYIASPYTVGNSADNVHVQLEAAHRILDMGHCPIAPLLSHYLHIHRPRPYGDWMAMDLAIIKRVDILLRLPGTSPGADREEELARWHGIPVAHGWKKLRTLLLLETKQPSQGADRKDQ